MRPRRLPASLSDAALKATWKNSRDSKNSSAGSPGIDGISALDFKRDLNGKIHRIREDIRHDRLILQPLRVVPIPKKNGKRRLIAVPTVGDRLVQRAIAQHLVDDAKFPNEPHIAFGFVKGRSLADAHNAAVQHRNERPWVLKTDIVSFFDEISRGQVESAVNKYIRCKAVLNIVKQVIHLELDYNDPVTSSLAIENGVVKGRGLRQGMPLSPMLSNLVMRPADKIMISHNFKVVRYADDIAFFCSSKAECEDVFNLVESVLQNIGLRVPSLKNSDKTRIYSPEEPCEFLGVDLKKGMGGNYNLSIPSYKIGSIRDYLLEMATVEMCFDKKMSIQKMFAHFDAVIKGHKYSLSKVDGIEDFSSRLDAVRDKAQNELLKSIIGAKVVDQLSEKKRAVLGLVPFEGTPRNSNRR